MGGFSRLPSRLLACFLLLLPMLVPAQATYKYVVYFSDKQGSAGSVDIPEEFLSEAALERRARQGIPVNVTDLPVPGAYVDSLASLGFTISATSRWLNAALVRTPLAPEAVILSELAFVRRAQWVSRTFADGKMDGTEASVAYREPLFWSAPRMADYGLASNQIDMVNGRFLHEHGFRGQGMTIAVLDAGFMNAGDGEAFRHVHQSGRLLGTFDAVDGDAAVYEASGHGTSVLSVMAGKLPGTYLGTAPEASYVLIRTEDVASEQLVEEFNYVLGLEYADQMGADVVNTSLGYTRFNHAEMDFGPADLNGDRLIATVGADLAASKGMLVVNSAGNEGASDWTFISRPADGDSVLAVGAVNPYRERSAFSGEGYPAGGNIKPNLMAQGERVAIVRPEGDVGYGNGTSFSAPVLAGLAACLWQAFPDKSNMEIVRALEQSGSRYGNPDWQYGYGIPDLQAAYGLLFHDRPETQGLLETFRIFPNPFHANLSILLPDDASGNLEVSLFNEMGQEFFRGSESVAGRKTLNLNFNGVGQLHTGLYFLKIETGREVFVFKLLKV